MLWLEVNDNELLLRLGPNEVAARMPVNATNSNAPLILETWQNLKNHSDQRAEDYLSGVLAGIIHGDLARMSVVEE